MFEVEDAFPASENTGPLELAAGKAELTDDEPPISRLDVRELPVAATWRLHVRRAVRAPGFVREVTEGSVARADALFLTSSPKPWCPEIFSTGLLPSRAECWGPFLGAACALLVSLILRQHRRTPSSTCPIDVYLEHLEPLSLWRRPAGRDGD